jgi:outer membrane lipopolysaccharide assembly protein LptE/RlpB
MIKSLSVLFVIAVWFTLTGCSYRLAGVKPLGESVRVVITSNAANVVRSQGYLQKEVAAAIENKLGWNVSPAGSAKLSLTIDEEKITAIGNDSRGIATRWNITLSGHVMLTSKHGTVVNQWSGISYSAGLNDEAAAIEFAANNAGLQIATWLESWIESQPALTP